MEKTLAILDIDNTLYDALARIAMFDEQFKPSEAFSYQLDPKHLHLFREPSFYLPSEELLNKEVISELRQYNQDENSMVVIISRCHDAVEEVHKFDWLMALGLSDCPFYAQATDDHIAFFQSKINPLLDGEFTKVVWYDDSPSRLNDLSEHFKTLGIDYELVKVETPYNNEAPSTRTVKHNVLLNNQKGFS